MAKLVPLPIAKNNYNFTDEQIFRNALERELQDIRDDMEAIEMVRTKTSSLSFRAKQFLLMGAQTGG
jgi:hypothetical protein